MTGTVPAHPSPPWWKFWQRWRDFHKVTAYATLLLAVGTIVLAVFSFIQISDFRDLERRQLRAYISVQLKTLRNFGESSPIEIFYETQNSGQTPAFDTRFFSTILPFSYPLPKETRFPEILEQTTMSRSVTVIFPKTTYNGFKIADKVLTHDDVEQIKTGNNKRLYFVGIARYIDAFKICHETKYCSSIGGPALREFLDTGGRIVEHLFQNCERFNDADYEGIPCPTDAK